MGGFLRKHGKPYESEGRVAAKGLSSDLKPDVPSVAEPGRTAEPAGEPAPTPHPV